METKEKVIYHIEYAKNGDIIASGGEICMCENIKYLLSKGEKNIILTTKKGKEAFIRWGLIESDLLSYNFIETGDPSTPIKLLLNYFKRVSLAKKEIEKININDNDIIFCHSDFFPNSIPLYFLSKKNKIAKIFFYFHMKYPSIFKGYEGEFIGKYSFPKPNMIYLKLNQILYLKIIKKINRGTIIGVNPYYGKYISSFLSNSKVNVYFLKVFGGASINYVRNNIKLYDGIWLGRFHKQKGVNELFKIVKLLKKEKNDFKLVVIGGGSIESEDDFKEKIKFHNLKENVIYKGFISGDEKFKILSQAKVFLMTSYFEGRPITIIEAMKLGIPVIAYDLPVYGVYKKGIIKVPILNNEKMSLEILKLLGNNNYYEEESFEALEFSSKYSWETTGEEIYNLIINLNKDVKLF